MEKPRLQQDPTSCCMPDCADGFGAAWALWKKYPDENKRGIAAHVVMALSS